MYYGNIKNNDIANGIGIRVSLFVSGCTNRCKNCFQPETWDFCYGNPFTEKIENQILDMLAPDHINGLTLLGGEPFEPQNQETLLSFVQKVKQKYPNKSIWCFSGFTYEELIDNNSYPNCNCTLPLLSLIDVLVDGRYVEEQRNLTLRFRGSENQRIINLTQTLKENKIVIWNETN